MRFARIAAAAFALGLAELVLGWRLSVLGVTADLLFVLAASAAIRLPADEGVPVACALGLFADFLLGGRLGLMALGFGLGARVIEGLHPVLLRVRSRGGAGGVGGGRWSGAEGRAGALARAGRLFVLVLVGAAVAHGTVAVLGAALGPHAGGVPARFARALEIAFLTGAVAPVAWPVLALVTGGPSAGGRRRSVLEA